MPSLIHIEDLVGEIIVTTSRSSGAGGQNVNKVETKVQLRFNVAQSHVLNDHQKEVIHTKLSSKLTKEGELIVFDESSRSQLTNKESAFKKLERMLNRAFFVPKKRKPTKPTKSSQRKRLTSKKQLGEKKKWRQRPDD